MTPVNPSGDTNFFFCLETPLTFQLLWQIKNYYVVIKNMVYFTFHTTLRFWQYKWVNNCTLLLAKHPSRLSSSMTNVHNICRYLHYPRDNGGIHTVPVNLTVYCLVKSHKFSIKHIQKNVTLIIMLPLRVKPCIVSCS